MIKKGIVLQKVMQSLYFGRKRQIFDRKWQRSKEKKV
jgi:hypothetical protein